MYNIKIYTRAKVFKDTLEIEKLEDVSDFTSEINGWFWTFNISLAYNITDTSIVYGDIIEIQYKKDLIYVGSVLSINKIYWSKRETIQLNLIGLGSLMSTLMTNETYTDTASNIIKDLINDFNSEYGTSILSFTAESIPDTVGNISVDFDTYKTYLEAMQEVASISGLYFFIDIEGAVTFNTRDSFNSHTLTVWLDVDTLTINEDGLQLTNWVRVKYKNWSSTGATTREASASQALYWKKEKYIDKSSEISSLATAQEFWDNYLVKYQDKIKKVSIIVNNKYTFFDIKAGDLVNVRNIWYEINNLQVARVTYWLDTATLELEIAYSFAKQVFIW